jgi:hypothetical protein
VLGALPFASGYVSGEFAPMLQALVSQRDAIESRALRGTFHDGLLRYAYRVIWVVLATPDKCGTGTSLCNPG